MPWEANDTRAKMVTSAALLLREHGVGGTSFAKVLAHSGGPRGSVGHHFPGGKRELVVDAVAFAGGLASDAIARAAERGDPPEQVFAMICRYYRKALVDSDFAASCPVGAVAQEGYDDPVLREAAEAVFVEWRTIFASVLVAHGRPRRDATELAELCVAALEGALMLARVAQSAAPLDRVQRQLAPLLAAG